MEDKCEVCTYKIDVNHIILDTRHWTVNLGLNHFYFGRAYVVLRNHKGSLAELSQGEWDDFKSVVNKMENAYKTLYNATPLNWSCLMNLAYKHDKPQPHVHWHVLPRYKSAPEFEGQRFPDLLFGGMYDTKTKVILSSDKVSRIALELRSEMAGGM